MKKLDEDCQTAIKKVEGQAISLENELKFRIDDCRALVDSKINRDTVETIGNQIQRDLIRQYDRKNEETIEKLNSIVRNIATSQEQLTIETKSTLQRHKAEIGRFEKTINTKAPKDQIEKITETLDDTRTAFDAQFNYQKNELKNGLDIIDKFRRTVTNLQSDMKIRDDALKKVPSNTA